MQASTEADGPPRTVHSFIRPCGRRTEISGLIVHVTGGSGQRTMILTKVTDWRYTAYGWTKSVRGGLRPDWMVIFLPRLNKISWISITKSQKMNFVLFVKVIKGHRCWASMEYSKIEILFWKIDVSKNPVIAGFVSVLQPRFRCCYDAAL